MKEQVKQKHILLLMTNTHVTAKADMSIHRTAKHVGVPFLKH
jgi:hypothetical protein